VENVTFAYVRAPGRPAGPTSDRLAGTRGDEPEVAARESHPALSDAVQTSFLWVEFVSVTEALVPVEPTFTSSGETWNRLFAPSPARFTDSLSTGEGELQAIEVHTTRMAAPRARRDKESMLRFLQDLGSMDGAGL
jgi:hypothetical protein